MRKHNAWPVNTVEMGGRGACWIEGCLNFRQAVAMEFGRLVAATFEKLDRRDPVSVG